MEKRPLRYSDEYRPSAYQLFELDEHLLAQLGLDAQGRPTATGGGGGSHHQLTIRGDPDDAAVVCSDERTYQARQAEVSNTLLIVRDGVAPPAADDDDPGPSVPSARLEKGCGLTLTPRSASVCFYTRLHDLLL